MVTTLISTPFDSTELTATVFDREKTGLFMLEHQLSTLLFDLQEKYNSISFKLESSGHPFDISISSEEVSGLFKIVAEAIDNCIRHSQGCIIQAEVKLINRDLIQFSISDNGSGFDLDKVAETKKHSGLKRICDYAHQINARVAFHSNLGRGTQVVVAKPIEKQRARFYTRLVALF